MSIVRWQLRDLVADETWVMPVNPNSAGSPFGSKSISTAQGLEDGGTGLKRMRLTQSPSGPVDWQFGGVVSTQEHHDELLRWARKSNEVRVSDHLGRTFEVIITQVEFVDRRPLPGNAWRFTYQMSALVLKEIS